METVLSLFSDENNLRNISGANESQDRSLTPK